MHPDAETRILSLALPLEEPNRSAFIKAATEAVEELGPNAYRPGTIPEPSVAILAVRPEHSFRVRPEHSFRLQCRMIGLGPGGTRCSI